MVNIEIDEGSGFCFGVTTAIRKAEEELAKGNTLYCLGDIVHNGQECERLKKMGLITINHEEFAQLHDAKVLLRAHGEPPETYAIARTNNIEIIDATCPVVLRLQKRIKQEYDNVPASQDTQIVIYGKNGHAEVLGLVGQTHGKAIVIETPAEAAHLDFTKDIRLYSQTTKSLEEFWQIIEYIKEHISPDATFEYYKKLEKECNKVKVVYYKDKFNYSKINNFGRKEAKGGYLLLLNNDTEMINDDCLNELLSYTERDDVGITGARLLYEDNTVQHAGVVIGYNGLAGHTFVGNEPDDVGYRAYVIQARDYSAVTAACLMVKASLYDEVGGFEEELEVAFNDVDFCLKVREKGYLVVYNPYAVLHHYESKSRGYEDTPEKRNRFEKEAFFTYNKWEKILADGDPCYNPNLTLSNSDFSLRE